MFIMLYIFITQILLNTPITKDPKEIKPHMSSHFIPFWERYGTARTVDTIVTEGIHRPYVKDVYRHSSMRRGSLLKEMFDRYVKWKLLKKAKIEYEQTLNLTSVQREIIRPSLNRYETINTNANIVYEFSTLATDRQEIYFDENGRCLRYTCDDYTHEDLFLNPLASLPVLLEQFERCRNMNGFLHSFKNHEAGNICTHCKQFEYQLSVK